MSDGGDDELAAALIAGLHDRRSAWACIAWFAAEWLRRPLRPGDGLDNAELAAVRADLTSPYPQVDRLPAAVEELYALVGHRRDLTSNQDTLLSGHQAELDPSRTVLVLRREAQGCAAWGIRVGDLDRDDPPVVMHAGDPDAWVPYAKRWSVACLEMVLFEAVLGPGLSWDLELDDGTVAMVERRYRRLPVPELPHWSLPEVRWFAGRDVLLRVEADTWLWALARQPEALDALRKELAP